MLTNKIFNASALLTRVIYMDDGSGLYGCPESSDWKNVYFLLFFHIPSPFGKRSFSPLNLLLHSLLLVPSLTSVASDVKRY